MRRASQVTRRMFLASAALAQQDDLSLALNAFAADYNAFVEALRAGTFDLRTAKRLNKRWQRIQDCGEWPR